MVLDVRKFGHKVRCDINGCRDLADYSVGDERVNHGRLNVCKKCLQQLILQAPKEMILSRPDIVDMVKLAAASTFIPEDVPELDGVPVQLFIEPDFGNMSMKELRLYAKTKGHSIPVGFTKEEAVVLARNVV